MLENNLFMEHEFINVRFIKVEGAEDLEIPKAQTPWSAGLDLRANVKETVTIKPGERMLIGTGIVLELNKEQFAFIVPRSGLAHKHGISIVNSPGTVDGDYRDEIFVNLINLGKEDFVIERGDRIAQMIIREFKPVKLEQVKFINSTERGMGGHGSTGVK